MSVTVKVFDSEDELDLAAAQWMAERIAAPSTVVGLATGSTPIGMYRHLVRMYKEGRIDFSTVRCFNLDEYVGIPHEHEQSFAVYMEKHLFGHVNIDRSRIHLPRGDAADPEAEADRYETLLVRFGPIDAQLLGIAPNGHIAFNEPGSPLDSRTHVVQLTEGTRRTAVDDFGSLDEVPTHAITVGIATLLESKDILLLAKGSSKAEAIRKALLNEPTVDLPASVLQLHPRTTFFLDKEAAAGLGRVDG